LTLVKYSTDFAFFSTDFAFYFHNKFCFLYARMLQQVSFFSIYVLVYMEIFLRKGANNS
jgi:hypothetical protein